jgi:hypothetical protein
MKALKKPVSFMMARRRAWLPPVIVALVLFAALLFFAKGKAAAPFLYRLF